MDITGLSKASVLAALYNASRPQGMGFLHYDPTPMTEAQAQQILDRGATYFDYLNNKWYVLRANFNLSDEKNVRLLFDKILSTFKFTGQYIPTSPTAEQQNVINYLEANITKLVKAKPVLGATKWYLYSVYFYDPDRIIVSFEDGHITGGFIGSYSVNGNVVSVQYIDEMMNTGNEINQLNIKYNLPSNKAIKYTKTSNSGFELVK